MLKKKQYPLQHSTNKTIITINYHTVHYTFPVKKLSLSMNINQVFFI